MPTPTAEPIGLHLARTAKVVSRAFDDTLGEVGGSLPVWLVLMALKGEEHAAQRELAQVIGIEGPTLTHHLNRMEAAGLVIRTRDPDNRRVHRVELTRAGDDLFLRLLGTVIAFDRRLRVGLAADDLAVLGGLLSRLRANVTTRRSVDTEGANP
jgi:MarR family transcriptional regulator for hemolysin